MSSGFVSGGTVDNPIERDDEWKVAQEELAAKRKLREEQGQQANGKSLFEVLQANKAAKQEAFEEATRLKNQFRALDDSEAEFLDSVLEATRKQEDNIRKETLEQLDAFRKHQEEEERKLLEQDNAPSAIPAEDAAQWVSAGRKRKKGNEKDGGLLRRVKLRKASSGATDAAQEQNKAAEADKESKKQGEVSIIQNEDQRTTDAESKIVANKIGGLSDSKITTTPAARPSISLSLGLGYASSDEDD